MATDLFLLLGVDRNASPEQLTAAYTHWAQELQPDPDSPATPALKELQNAYSTLAQPARRRSYEAQSREERLSRQPARASAEPLRPAPQTHIQVRLEESEAEFHPSFEELFERLWSNFASLTRPKAERLESLTVEIPLTREEAAQGGRATVLIPARARCPACRGRGAVGLYQCWRCQGHGAVTADYPLEVPYPAGVLSEYTVRLPLERFGISNFYLTLRFRVTGAE